LNDVVGLIDADDLIDRLIVQKVSQGTPRSDVLVEQLMTPRKDLLALDIQRLQGASIGDVIEALQDSGKQHCLVIDSQSHRIRGVFSASDISRKLHLPINIQDKSSFYRVFASSIAS
ncbi:MAG: histidine kinase, partial [Pseudomonadota bacterium]